MRVNNNHYSTLFHIESVQIETFFKETFGKLKKVMKLITLMSFQLDGEK